MLKDNLGEAEPDYINKSSFHMMTNPIIPIAEEWRRQMMERSGSHAR